MAYRFPQNSDFEEYLKKVVRVKCGYRQDDDQIITFPREDPKPWEDYKMEEDVGCLRKLWNLAIQVSKRQMERMAGEDGDLKAKVTLTTAQELEDKAVESGMPVPASDRDRPSLHTLTKVQGVFGPGGSFQHLPWETYVSMEHEGKLRRAGKIPKDKKEVILEDKKLSLTSASDEAENFLRPGKSMESWPSRMSWNSEPEPITCWMWPSIGPSPATMRRSSGS